MLSYTVSDSSRIGVDVVLIGQQKANQTKSEVLTVRQDSSPERPPRK